MFFVRLFLSSALSSIVLTLTTDIFEFKMTTIEKLSYYFLGTLRIIAYVCVIISILGMIWTFQKVRNKEMIYTGQKVYDPLTNTYSTGYWVKDSKGYWYPVWNN